MPPKLESREAFVSRGWDAFRPGTRARRLSGDGGHGKGRVPLPLFQLARALLALWFETAPKLRASPISSRTSSPSWRKQPGLVDRQHEHICGTLERILSCGGITRSGLRNHPGSLGHADGVAIQAETVEVLSRHAPRCPRCTSSTRLQLSLYTAPAPIVEYLSGASAVDAAPAPVVVNIPPAPVALQQRWCMLHPSPS